MVDKTTTEKSLEKDIKGLKLDIESYESFISFCGSFDDPVETYTVEEAQKIKASLLA